jgi:hypothetical protein
MLKNIVTGVCVLTFGLIAQAQATPAHDWKQVSKALTTIWAANGETILERIESCKIKPQKEASWVDVLTADNPDYGAKKGDTVVMLKLDFPQIQGYPALTGISALWVIGPHKAIPVSQWANNLQTHPVPLGSGMKC